MVKGTGEAIENELKNTKVDFVVRYYIITYIRCQLITYGTLETLLAGKGVIATTLG